MPTHPSAPELIGVILLECTDAAPYVGGVFAAVAHIPRYWAVEPQEREEMARLFEDLKASVRTAGGAIRFSSSVRPENATAFERIREIFQERMNSLSGKAVVGVGMEKVQCVHAIGLDRETLEATLLVQDSQRAAPVSRRMGA